MNTHHLLVQRIRINGIPSPLSLYTIETSSIYILIYDKKITSNAHLTIGRLIGIWGTQCGS